MRQVFTHANPPPKDLHGQDLADSYFGGAEGNLLDCRNINLSGCDLTNVTFVYCNLSGADLRGAKVYGCYTRFNNWTDAKLSENSGHRQREWIAELFRQGAVHFTGGKAQVCNVVGSYSLVNYDLERSWKMGWPAATSVLSVADCIEVGRKVVEGYPSMSWRFEKLLEQMNVGSSLNP